VLPKKIKIHGHPARRETCGRHIMAASERFSNSSELSVVGKDEDEAGPNIPSASPILAPRNVTWKGALWDTFDAPRDERKLLFKLDAVLLTFASLGYRPLSRLDGETEAQFRYFTKNLDQSNLNSAFVSGMKEDLGMYGNQLTTAITMWTIGYVLGRRWLGSSILSAHSYRLTLTGQIPSNMYVRYDFAFASLRRLPRLLTRISPRWWIPALEIGWGVCTLFTYKVQSYQAVCYLTGHAQKAAHMTIASCSCMACAS
jgi:ACS family pantothenate transporter-like MFS transporter